MKIETTWDLVKLAYWKNFKIPPRVVDLIAVQSILRKCVSGYGNRTICFATDEQINYIRDTLLYFLGFAGWDTDLDINPLAIFNNSKDYENFEQNIIMISNLMTDDQIFISYKICGIYKRIESEINKYHV